jgi:hypothetical protein
MIEVVYQEEEAYLVARVGGQWDTDGLKQQIEAIRAMADQCGKNRILVDLRQLSPPPVEMDRFWAGEHAARHWRLIKVAVLAQPELINHFAETVAANRGVYLQVFSDKKAAIEWLVG